MNNTKHFEDNDILSINDILEYLGIGRTTLYLMRKKKNFPKGFSLTGTKDCKWYFKDIREWFEQQKNN